MKLTIYRDNTPTIRFQLFHADNTVVSLLNCSILLCGKMDQSQTNAQSLFQKSTFNGTISIVDVMNGIFETQLLTSDTQALKDTTFIYLDCLITDGSGEVFTVANVTTLEIRANFSRV